MVPAKDFAGYCIAGFGVVLVFAVLCLAPFLNAPVPRRTAGIVFSPGFDDRTSLSAVARADPSARVVDVRWHGLLVFVQYEDAGFPAAVARLGALHMFDAVAAGCHR